MILNSCKHEINENTVNLFTEIEINGKIEEVKFRTFIFNEHVSDIIYKDERILFKIITEDQFTLFIFDEDYELIKQGKLKLPCVIVDMTKSDFDID
jgi:hypothetical protein